MAVAELNLSRREVLAAALAVPVAGAASPRRRGSSLRRHQREDRGPDSGAEDWTPGQARGTGRAIGRAGKGDDPQSFVVTKWDRALAALRRAEAALAAVAGTEDEELYGDRVVAFNRAVERLLVAPLPDPRACPEQSRSALAAKLALAVDQAAWELPAGDACMAALVRDGRRLCG